MTKKILLAIMVMVMAISVAIGSLAAVSACHLCWTERTFNVEVRDQIGVLPSADEEITVVVYTGCCTSTDYTITNLTDKGIYVYIERVGEVPEGIRVCLKGGSPVWIESGASQDVTVWVCADCDVVEGSVTYRFAGGYCLSPEQISQITSESEECAS